MADIVEIAAGDRRLQLGKEEFGRTFQFGTKWIKLRLGFLATWQYTLATFSSAGPVFGICQGTTDMYRSASCTDFIGVGWSSNYPVVSTWTGNTTRYTHPGSSFTHKFISNIGGVEATTAGIVVAGNIDAAPTIHQMFLVDVTKQPGRVVLQARTHSAAGTDCNLDNFYRNMQNESNTMSPAQGTTTTTGVTYTGNALWDTVNIVWDRWNPLMQISGVLVMRYR
jgi:hypothetical protein